MYSQNIEKTTSESLRNFVANILDSCNFTIEDKNISNILIHSKMFHFIKANKQFRAKLLHTVFYFNIYDN